ncbi:MAG: hypothetical protein K0R61_1249 [Microvirga sp.]|jgi:hypothetical protein|nr:hypothetical protein [Microvirga sp.]MCD6070199.1 hypothetical protein [Microvirga sp.]MDF2687133.1 hypothetical protein [Microvirga sp.]MDF2970799.1 hypothetical protein [Microvirga sp.]
MDDLTSKTDDATVEADLALAHELSQARGVKLVPGSASTAAVGETV